MSEKNGKSLPAIITNPEKRLNDGHMKDGQLDEFLKFFFTMPIDEQSGSIVFQFETGGCSLTLKADMTMEQIADKFEWFAERIRYYKRNGWPDYSAENLTKGS